MTEKLLKMGATWCTNCKSQTKLFEATPPPVEIQEVDIDKEFELARQYRIRSVPTLILVDESGTELKRHVGLLQKDKYEEFFKV